MADQPHRVHCRPRRVDVSQVGAEALVQVVGAVRDQVERRNGDGQAGNWAEADTAIAGDDGGDALLDNAMLKDVAGKKW